MYQHQLGDLGFWFCHWILGTENQIHEKLKAKGADKLLLTQAKKMEVYVTADEGIKKLYRLAVDSKTS